MLSLASLALSVLRYSLSDKHAQNSVLNRQGRRDLRHSPVVRLLRLPVRPITVEEAEASVESMAAATASID